MTRSEWVKMVFYLHNTDCQVKS